MEGGSVDFWQRLENGFHQFFSSSAPTTTVSSPVASPVLVYAFPSVVTDLTGVEKDQKPPGERRMEVEKRDVREAKGEQSAEGMELRAVLSLRPEGTMAILLLGSETTPHLEGRSCAEAIAKCSLVARVKHWAYQGSASQLKRLTSSGSGGFRSNRAN